MNRISSLFANYDDACYSESTWRILKMLFVFFWFGAILNTLFSAHVPSAPVGICLIFDCYWLQSRTVRVLLGILGGGLSLCYLSEFRMTRVLFLLSLYSVVVFTYSDSSGVLKRLQGFTVCLIAQFFAYYFSERGRSSQPLNLLRIKLPHQGVVALYTLAAISKLADQGLNWAISYKGLAVQVYKSWLYEYVTTGAYTTKLKADAYFEFIMNHPVLTSVGLGLTLFLETFVSFSLVSRKAALCWGIGLTFMHFGIYFGMDIFIGAIVVPMVLFLVNPPALVLAGYVAFCQNDCKKNFQ